MKALMLLALPTMLFAAPGVQTHEQGHGRRGKIETLDKNDDGRISKDEAKGTRLEKHFTEIDTNKDGSLTRAELKAARQKHARATPAEIIAKHDTNGNKTLEANEVEQSRWGKFFAKIDADGNGSVTEAELQEAKKKFAQHHRKHHKRGHRGGGDWFGKLDANQDGRLSAKEVEGKRLADNFNAIDTNKDGALTREELKAAFGKHGKNRRGHGHHAKKKGSGATPKGAAPGSGTKTRV